MNNNQISALDLLSILSFGIALENLDMNISQLDVQRMTKILDADLRKEVDAIHAHLEEQDQKINYIIKMLEERGGTDV